MCSCNIVLVIAGVLGAILIVLGSILGFAVIPPIIEDQIIEKVQLKQDTEQYDRWVTTPMPLSFKVHIFEVVNVDEVMAGTAKPTVEEKGPFVYKQYRVKKNVNYNEEDDTLEYEQNLRFEFDAEASAPYTEDQEVTVLNVPLQGLIQYGEGKTIESNLINVNWQKMFPDTTSIFHKIKVKDFLFDGYRFCSAELTGGASTVCGYMAGKSQTITKDDESLIFSFFNHKVVKNDGPYVIKAGNDDVHETAAIRSWNGLEYITQWADVDGENKCNKIRGRDSSIYPPFNNDTSKFDVFNTDICRIVNLRTKELSSYKDIKGYVATLDKDTMSNTGNGECYCTKLTRNLEGEATCLPEGFGDSYSCHGAPVVISFPHFLWANETYSSTVDGLTPSEEKHKTFVMIEPGTGTPLQGAKRMQFNMVIRPIARIRVTDNLIPAVMPILWVEEGVELTDKLVQQLNDDYLSKLVMVDAITYTLIGVGIFLLVVGFGAFIFRKCC